MIRPDAPNLSPSGSFSPSSSFLKPPELPRIAVPPGAGFTLEQPAAETLVADRLRSNHSPAELAQWSMKNEDALKQTQAGKEPLREAFRDFVGQTLFGQMLASMRSTVGKPAYFHGGRAEEVFSQQLDQVLVEKITNASASTVADPMFELFNMQRSQ